MESFTHMNDLPTQKQAQEAVQFMAEQVYGPAFFEKLAAHGVRPNNTAEARQLLTLGATLEQAEASGLYKTAAEAENPFLAHVTDRLSGALSQHQAAPNQQAQSLVHQDPLMKAAALIYAHVAAGGETTSDAPAAA